MPSRKELEAFLDAPDEPAKPSRADLEAFLDAPDEPKKPRGDSRLAEATAAAQTTTFGAADELQAASETIPYAVGEAFSGRGLDIHDLVDYYKYRRNEYRKEAAQLAQTNPTETAVGTAVGVGAQLLAGGVNPAGVVRGLVTGGRALLSVEGALGAGRALLSAEGAQAAATGAAYGGLAAAGASEADTASELASDLAKGAGQGALVGAGARGLLGAAEGRLAARTASTEAKVPTAIQAEGDKALLETALEGKQRKLGGPAKAKERAQALLAEPQPGDPSKKLFEEAKQLRPDERYGIAQDMRREQGRILGAIRDELGQKEIEIPTAPLLKEIRNSFSGLPSQVQEKALKQVQGMFGAVSKDGSVQPAQLRKLIEDAEGLGKVGTPEADSALGNARRRVFEAARSVLVGKEQELIAQALPDKAPQYTEALRKYRVYSDFEESSKVQFERANKGQKTIKETKKVLPNTPRALLAKTIAGEVGARVGSLVPIPGSTYAGAKAGEGIVDIWRNWTGPTSSSLSAKVQKLERLKPMMEEALDKGPEEVARLHALFMARSPDYRKALESGE